VILGSFRRHYLVVVQARVEYDPRDQESGERRHEALLDQLPNSAIGVLVHVLEVDGVQVDDPAADAGESGIDDEDQKVLRLFIGYSYSQYETQEALQRDYAPDDAEEDAEHLAGPVDHVQKLLLRGFGVKRAGLRFMTGNFAHLVLPLGFCDGARANFPQRGGFGRVAVALNCACFRGHYLFQL